MYQERVKRLQKLLEEHSCDGLIVEDPINLYYLTGFELSAGKFFVHTHGCHLIVDGRYFEVCKKNSPFPVILAEKEDTLFSFFASEELHFVKTIGFNSQGITYHRFLALETAIEKVNKKSGRKIAFKPLENPVGDLRSVKSVSEINVLREAAELGSEGFDFVCTLLKEGVTEEEICIELSIFWKRRGGKKVAFDPIIAFGANSSMPHYRSGKTHLKKGDAVLIDIGVNYQHYHSDMTRVVYFGKPNPKIEEIFSVVQKSQEKAFALCRPGTCIGDLDAAARGYIAQEGYGEYFTHSLGHGVGLEIHEAPTVRKGVDACLQEGMVITIEPGIYLPGVGGVRIEDMVVIQPDGYENLTNREI